ncbi:hypothetical protein CFC21_063540 [Triticum aestivum]|uniref:Uncharacterized protein n=2 Tax=Triticum aestivum TaxID=4565 RepID=A0A3B6U704_WHEAT|nr:hypothetical protein CFC21_063540 [Triticum aestivum]
MGDIGSRRWDYLILAAIVLGALAAIALILCLTIIGARGPLYSAAIDAATGLDGADLGRYDLNPLFNLTLRVASRSIFSGDCTAPGTVVEVSYAGVPLAAGPVQRFCTKRRGTRDLQAIAAWGTAVQVLHVFSSHMY